MKKTNQDQAKLKDGINDDVKQQLLQMKQNLAVETGKREEQKRQDLLRQQKERQRAKMIFILALCLLFSVIENLCSLGRTSTGAERI